MMGHRNMPIAFCTVSDRLAARWGGFNVHYSPNFVTLFQTFCLDASNFFLFLHCLKTVAALHRDVVDRSLSFSHSEGGNAGLVISTRYTL